MNLDVLIPSLLLPAPMHSLSPPPLVPALERLLARADRQVVVTPAGASWLCERWGIGAPYPIAPLLAEYDGIDVLNDGWMFAEPFHITPDRNLSLFPGRFLELNTVESAELVSALNSHFADRYLRFFTQAPTIEVQRWYVRVLPTEIPATTPPDVARFGSLVDFLPRSAGTMDWRSLQNETQMLFFGHPVNEARETSGKPAVSGVWFWGGGVLPELRKPSYDHIVADSALPSLLAKKSGIDLLPLSWQSVQSSQGNVLVVIESCSDLARDLDLRAWARELERLDREWFLPLSQALAKGAIQSLSIHVPGDECTRSFHITRRSQLLRFWRAAKPLSTYA